MIDLGIRKLNKLYYMKMDWTSSILGIVDQGQC